MYSIRKLTEVHFQLFLPPYKYYCYFVCRLLYRSSYKYFNGFSCSIILFPLSSCFSPTRRKKTRLNLLNIQVYLVIQISNNASSAISLFLLQQTFLCNLLSLMCVCVFLLCLLLRFPPGAQIFVDFYFAFSFFNFHTTFPRMK